VWEVSEVWIWERDGNVSHNLQVFYSSAFQIYDWQGVRYNVLTRSLPMPQMIHPLLIIGFSFPGNLGSSWKSLETSIHVFSLMWTVCQYTPSEVWTYVLYSYTKPDLKTVFIVLITVKTRPYKSELFLKCTYASICLFFLQVQQVGNFCWKKILWFSC